MQSCACVWRSCVSVCEMRETRGSAPPSHRAPPPCLPAAWAQAPQSRADGPWCPGFPLSTGSSSPALPPLPLPWSTSIPCEPWGNVAPSATWGCPCTCAREWWASLGVGCGGRCLLPGSSYCGWGTPMFPFSLQSVFGLEFPWKPPLQETQTHESFQLSSF